MEYKSRKFQRYKKVWEEAHGPVPQGQHLHHKDLNPGNDSLENLQLLSPKEHAQLHQRLNPKTAMPKECLDEARTWHQSEEGISWHRKHYHDFCKESLHQRIEKVCEVCGESFQGLWQSKYCSNKCKARARRASGIDDVKRICVSCGEFFTVDKYRTTRTCSRKCAGAASSITKRSKP
ncbi:MAG: HNH endonuclease [Thermotogae bacterium]|nr:MAG: HNH endonuclease [Thermotogota bacterium]